MEEAFVIIEESSKVLMEITKIKPLHYRLLEKMLEEDKPCTNQHFLTYHFIPSSWTKKILEVVELAKGLASERKYIWTERSSKGVIYYEVSSKDTKTEKVLDKVDEKEEAESVEQTEEELLKLLYD